MMKKSIPFYVLAFLLPAMVTASPHPAIDDFESLRAHLEAMPPMEMDEVIWLARCVYSESNLPNEQEHIAWVVRNRVDTQYRGSTYREVILEPLQFSLFNANSPRRNYILGLNQNSKAGPWQKALSIALKIYEADPNERPFSVNTRHFYSPVSMKNNLPPDWAVKADPLDSKKYDIDPHRFLFFEKIDASEDPFLALKSPRDHIESFKSETQEKLEPARARKTSLRERLKPSGRVYRPARPNTRSTRGSSTAGKKRSGW